MKKSRFSHLLQETQTDRDHLPTKSAKKAVLILLTLFFILYVNYKPYTMTPHQINGILEFLFILYQFVINQTLGIVHEGGHGVCYILPCPKFIMVAMGTVFQWLFPLGIAYYYKKRGNQTAFLIGLFILGISMDYTAWYM
ncbi:MAG TPA: hypothetical protein ENO02_05020, partial [Epsilonproteobacteria bacterium]|nr:hypothetical protein [Campylobacterota bacterium]